MRHSKTARRQGDVELNVASMFHGNELPRLLTMLAFLAVLGVMFVRFRDLGLPDDGLGGVAQPARAAAADNGAGAKPPAAQATGPTDEDSDEWSAAEEEFEAVTDGTEQMTVDDMAAYRRLFGWVRSQSYEALAQRARSDTLYTHLHDAPKDFRGKLVKVRLRVRRVVKWEKADAERIFGPGAAGIDLYEVCGFTVEGKSALYSAAVIGWPEDLAVGDGVDERADVVGYFFKLQGYRDRGPGGGKPIRVPLLLGRAVPLASGPLVASNELLWAAVAGCTVVAVIVLSMGIWFIVRLRRKPLPPVGATTTGGGVGVEEWLGQTTAGTLNEGDDEGNNFDPEPDSTNGRAAGNGHGRDIPRLFPDHLDGGHSSGG